MKVYFTRHGESDHNLMKKVAGTTDSPLTEKGYKQAKEASKKIQNMGITKIYSSNLVRAKETARVIAESIGLDVNILPELSEVHYGDIQDKPYPESRTFIEMIELGLCNESETLLDLEKRARFVLDFLKIYNKETILCVGHGSFTALIFAVAQGLSSKDFVEYRIGWSFENTEVKELII